MSSTFGWLDTDDQQRKSMLEVVDLFKEDGTVDELGIGSIRDALADALFPGTSVLHTRLRYVVFIPWLLQRSTAKSTASQMSAEFRALEFRLIGSLMAGGEVEGVIGNRARASLKRLPSSVYWAALGAWGIRRQDMTIEASFRRQVDQRRLMSRTATADDADGRETLPGSGIDPHLPNPPANLVSETDFALTAEEESYLSDRIVGAEPGSLLAWLVHHVPSNLANASASALPDYAWNIDNIDDAPPELAQLVDHARRFHTAIHGAPLVYNLLLAQRGGHGELIDTYTDAIAAWHEELEYTSALDGWNREQWWQTIDHHNPRLRTATRRFVDDWLDLIATGTDVATDANAHRLVRNREIQIKGGRARLVNQSALDRWPGASGLTRLDYRWSVGRRHLLDLYAAREVS
jgi:hypothetical protein